MYTNVCGFIKQCTEVDLVVSMNSMCIGFAEHAVLDKE